jgi:hypothetical protein
MHLLKSALDIHCCTIWYVWGPWYPSHGLFVKLGPNFLIICMLILTFIPPPHPYQCFLRKILAFFILKNMIFTHAKDFWRKKTQICQLLKNKNLNCQISIRLSIQSFFILSISWFWQLLLGGRRRPRGGGPREKILVKKEKKSKIFPSFW